MICPENHDGARIGFRGRTAPVAFAGCTGFALIELAIALAILGILVGIAAPSFSATVAESRLKDLQRSLAGTLRTARAEAGMRSERVVLCARASDTACGEDWSGGWLAFVDGNAGTRLALDAGETVLQAHPPASDDRISIVVTQQDPWSTVIAATSTVGIEPRTRSGTALFVLCDARGAERARTVVSTPSGTVRTNLGENAAGERLDPWNEAIECPS